MKQLSGFAREREFLRERVGLTYEIVDVPHVSMILHQAVAHHPDVMMVLPTWKDPAEQVIEAFRRVYEREVRPALVFMDTYDPTSSPHFGVLPYVDRYLKRSLLTDFAGYHRSYAGGHILSHHAETVLGFDLKDWSFASPVTKEHEHKLRGCWSFGAASDFATLLRRASQLAPSWRRRVIDVNCRIGLSAAEASENTWYRASRLAAATALQRAGARHRCTGCARTGRRRYLFELLQSKIVFSPFGWGEVCFRDYEAACAGCLLIKPDMSHVRTSPDIFEPHVTYIPVSWDYRDLEEAVERALANPEGSLRIAAAAQERLRKYYQDHGFAHDLVRCLEGLGSMTDASLASTPPLTRHA